MNTIRQDLAKTMAEKPDEQLADMFTKPSEWTPEALDAARAELCQRAVPLPPEPAQRTTSQQERRQKRQERAAEPVQAFWAGLAGGAVFGLAFLFGAEETTRRIVFAVTLIPVLWGFHGRGKLLVLVGAGYFTGFLGTAVLGGLLSRR